MDIQKHSILTIDDENGINLVEEFFTRLGEKSKTSKEAKMHLMFLNSAFNLLSVNLLKDLLKEKTEITITIDGKERTKSYQLIKPLRVRPIYELRYAVNGNEHLRFLFFPIAHKGRSNYVFVKCFLKTRDPNVDDTDKMRDLTFEMYKRVKRNPEYYIEGVEES